MSIIWMYRVPFDALITSMTLSPDTKNILDIRSLTFRGALNSLIMSYANPCKTSENQQRGRRIKRIQSAYAVLRSATLLAWKIAVWFQNEQK